MHASKEMRIPIIIESLEGRIKEIFGSVYVTHIFRVVYFIYGNGNGIE